MLGIVYTDSGTDKLIKIINGTFTMDIPSNIHVGSTVLNPIGPIGFAFFKNTFFTSKSVSFFRFVNVAITPDDNFDIHETPNYSPTEKMAFVSSDNLNIIAYRGTSYQAVTVASLLASEIINLGALSFTDMQLVMTAAAGLTSPQIKYVSLVGNDTVSISEIV